MHDESAVPALELRGIRKSFGERTVLDDISLTVQRGEFFALLGPSGSGKSTLLKMVSGIDSPDAGEVWLGGRNVTGVPPYRRSVHTVFQNYALFPHLDVTGNVGFPLRVKGVPRSERTVSVRQALIWVQMESFASRRVAELSGGERQRVALARSLVDEPECVLLDEPLSALDPHLRGRTLELLREIQGRLRATYLYVTHDREEALGAAHRLGIMRDGRLMQVGTPEEIYQRPCCPFVAGFAGPISWFEGTRSANGSSIRLNTGDEIPCMPDCLPTAKRVTVGIRPESVRLHPDGLLRGEVMHRQFSGASVLLQLRMGPQAMLTAQVDTHSNPPQVGERVGVTWDPASLHFFAADDGTRAHHA